MVLTKLLVLFVAGVWALPPTPVVPAARNTIFADERFQGEVFENVEDSNDVEPISTALAVSPYRLPTTTVPSHYNILWIINMEALSYSGTVEITLQATQTNVNEVVIHCDHVTIPTQGVVLRLGNTIIPTTYTLQPEYQFLKVAITDGVLQYDAQNPVSYTLTIDFSAEMRTDMYGIYRSWYRNTPSEPIRWMATTQFQPSAARYAFPCYDEPGFKAKFNITIRRPINFKSWTCTRRSNPVPTPSVTVGYEDDIYHTTPLMSTYLIAIIVAEYESVSHIENDLVMHEVIARSGAIDAGQADYAQSAGQALLDYMSTQYTGYNFYDQDENLKMTQAAIPDFGAGAMENWGLLTYREAYLLYDSENTSSYFKQLIAYILSHEIAHMWYGNLVTNQWWDVLWLNEGFARYYQYFLTSKVEGMGLDTRFINEQVHTSLLSDSANNPQPLTNPSVASPKSVSDMFSTITYNKGASVLRMTEHFLGTTVFEQGLRKYLRDYEFKVVRPIDLFNTLDQTGKESGAFAAYGSNFNFVEYFQSWTEQPGHPVLNVQINHHTGQMVITQRRFNINTGYSAQNTRYIIPITFTSASNFNFDNTKPTHVLSAGTTVINRNSVGDHWTIFNIQQTGFYRVNYDDYTWDLITKALRTEAVRNVIHPYNRAQIVNDVFQFARSGIMKYEKAMNILSFLEYETSYAPWMAAITGFNWLRNRLITVQADLLTELDATIEQWSKEAITKLGYQAIQDEPFLERYLRFQLAPLLCNINVAACRDAARDQFLALRAGTAQVHVDNRNWVYCNALRMGSQDDFEFLWTRFINHNVYTEKILLLQVLGCTTHEASLIFFLNQIINDNQIIRPQDYTTAFNSAVSGNEENTQRVFTYVQNNLIPVINAFGNATVPLSYISARLRTPAQVAAFQQWANNTRTVLGDAWETVYYGSVLAAESIEYAESISEDLASSLESGPTDIVTTSTTVAPTTEAVTSVRPSLVQPVIPSLPPKSSATSVFSLFTVLMLALATVVHITV